MQINLGLIIGAVLVSVSPVLGADFVWFAGADCTGTVVASETDWPAHVCFALPNGGSAKSVSYTDVPNKIEFFESGGQHDNCANGPVLTFGGGSGCATAPDGVNLESFGFD